jgi:hypothetical protein
MTVKFTRDLQGKSVKKGRFLNKIIKISKKSEKTAKMAFF